MMSSTACVANKRRFADSWPCSGPCTASSAKPCTVAQQDHSAPSRRPALNEPAFKLADGCPSGRHLCQARACTVSTVSVSESHGLLSLEYYGEGVSETIAKRTSDDTEYSAMRRFAFRRTIPLVRAVQGRSVLPLLHVESPNNLCLQTVAGTPSEAGICG